MRAKRLAPRPDGPLTHFASPRGEKCRLEAGVSLDEFRHGLLTKIPLEKIIKTGEMAELVS